MTLENAIDRYLAARKELEAARKELEVAKKILLENAPYKVGDKVRIRFQTISIPAFVTEVNISDWNNADDLFHFVVRLPTKGGAFSDRTKVIDYHAYSKDLQLDN